MIGLAEFPYRRARRTRSTQWIRDLTAESILSINDLIWPIFIMEVKIVMKICLSSGSDRLSIDLAIEKSKQLFDKGLCCVALFPYTSQLKTPNCEEAWDPGNLVKNTRALKSQVPVIMLDVARPYNSLGDGLVRNGKDNMKVWKL